MPRVRESDSIQSHESVLKVFAGGLSSRQCALDVAGRGKQASADTEPEEGAGEG
jgi:hypothetical protein